MNKFEIANVKNFAVDFFGKHSAVILTGSTIACNVGGIVATYKNSPKIHEILEAARDAFEEAGDDKEKKREIAKQVCKDLAPLVAPIIIFFAASSTSAIVNHKKSEAKIAALSAALSLAKTTIDEYDSFKNKVREEVGEPEYREMKKQVAKQTIEKEINKLEPDTLSAIKDVKMGEVLCCIPEFGIFFSGTKDKMVLAMERINGVLERNGREGESYGMTSPRGNEIVMVTDLLDELDIYHHRPKMCDSLGWEAGTIRCVSYWIGDGHTDTGIPYLTLEIDTRPEFID